MIRVSCFLAASLLALGAVSSAMRPLPLDSTLIDVNVSVSSGSYSRGSAVTAQVGLFNLSTDQSLGAVMRAEVIYANGRRQRLPVTEHLDLGPEGGMIKRVIFLIPKGAPLGTATVRVYGRVTWASGGPVDRADRYDEDETTFQVTL